MLCECAIRSVNFERREEEIKPAAEEKSRVRWRGEQQSGSVLPDKVKMSHSTTGGEATRLDVRRGDLLGVGVLTAEAAAARRWKSPRG